MCDKSLMERWLHSNHMMHTLYVILEVKHSHGSCMYMRSYGQFGPPDPQRIATRRALQDFLAILASLRDSPGLTGRTGEQETIE